MTPLPENGTFWKSGLAVVYIQDNQYDPDQPGHVLTVNGRNVYERNDAYEVLDWGRCGHVFSPATEAEFLADLHKWRDQAQAKANLLDQMIHITQNDQEPEKA